MNRSLTTHLLATLLCVVFTAEVCAQNSIVTYQGQVQSDGTYFTGTGQFKFALVTVSNAASRATAEAVLSGQFVIDYVVTYGGGGYATPPAVTISGGGGSGATATAVIAGGVVTGIQAELAGTGYTSPPMVTIELPPETVAYTTYWSNDGTSVDGSEPSAAVSVPVAALSALTATTPSPRWSTLACMRRSTANTAACM